MPSRFVIFAVFLASISPIPASHAQQITSDVVISGASLNDGYMGWAICDAEGQIYRGFGGRENAVMRVARDGSTLRFALPELENAAGVFAPVSPGLAILNSSSSRGEATSYRMYRFDAQGNIVARRPVSIDFHPTIMTATSSGKMIVVGYRPQSESWIEASKYGGAVLDADDQVVQVFEFPPAAAGDKWTPIGPRMAGGDGIAYLILRSGTRPTYAIATISESGHVDINVLSVPPSSDKRHHNEWLFGPGIAVEGYHFVGEKPHVKFRFDEYDLTSGKKIRTKATFGAGFVTGCYSGDEISYLVHSAHVEKARGLSPETLRLVTVKLEESKAAPEAEGPALSSPFPAAAR
jgi:hypothetical protein